MRFLRRLCIEGVSSSGVESKWLWWFRRDYDNRLEKRVEFMYSPIHLKGYEDCTDKEGQKKVLDVFLGHGDNDEDEDEVFVTTLWWCLLVALVIYCIKRLQAMGHIWLYL